MSAVAYRQGMSVCELVAYIRTTHGKTVNEHTIYKWIVRGRRGKDGEVKFLKSNQLGRQAPHYVAHRVIDAYIKWLSNDSVT